MFSSVPSSAVGQVDILRTLSDPMPLPLPEVLGRCATGRSAGHEHLGENQAHGVHVARSLRVLCGTGLPSLGFLPGFKDARPEPNTLRELALLLSSSPSSLLPSRSLSWSLSSSSPGSVLASGDCSPLSPR